MANIRKILKRRKSVNNICKITRTMEMIATSRLKKASARASAGQLYTRELEKLQGLLAGNVQDISHPLIVPNARHLPSVVLIITSNRGLCGGYNGSLIREANHQINLLRYEGHKVELHISGKKGNHYFRYKNQPISRSYYDYDYQTTFQNAEDLANEYMDMYTSHQVRLVKVVYTRFVSAAKLSPETITLLPVDSSLTGQTKNGQASSAGLTDYIFVPDINSILEQFFPASVCIRMFQCFLDAIASEQVARMRSMKAATDNAEQMINNLTSIYNRARQGQITGDLLDIMGGVEALK
jgi:F-type H+-transporting ATPase subunit gamma